jgi:hypothetical protein
LISFSRLFCNKFIFFETILYPSLNLNCDYLLCTNCYQLHRKVKSLDEHQIVDIKDIASHGKESVIKRNFKNIGLCISIWFG